MFSAGGATIYERTLPLADAMYISYIQGDFAGDSRFPEFDEREWRVVERRDHVLMGRRSLVSRATVTLVAR